MAGEDGSFLSATEEQWGNTAQPTLSSSNGDRL